MTLKFVETELASSLHAIATRALSIVGLCAISLSASGAGTADAVEDAVGQDRESLPLRELIDELMTAESESPDEEIAFGGALRFNYAWNDYSDDLKTRRGDTGLDIFRINADGSIKNLLLSLEYRFYPYMSTIHHGWIGYDFDGAGQLQGGVMQVPFGLLPYASHNFWFGVPYYVGLEDDYDLGVKWLRGADPWDLQLAFFKNEELGDASDLSRYSYDPIITADSSNEETNTVNARIAYIRGNGAVCSHEAGISGQYGELFNTETGENGGHWAAALHFDSRCGRWNPQLEIARYGYDPKNPAGVDDDVMTVGAFEAPHQIAARGTLLVANLAYNLPVAWPGVNLLTCYDDFSMLRKDREDFDDSYLNTTGCVMQVGPTYTYFDVIRGRNMVFFDDGSLAGVGTDDWETRVNINFGYYW